jgi:glucosamine kinase
MSLPGPSSAARSYVIGVDGGDILTRVVVADLRGAVRGYAEAGPVSVTGASAVHHVIRLALADADASPAQVRAVVAGVAGYESASDHPWVDALTALPELRCPRCHVSEAVIAHAGALLNTPGILLMAGTRSFGFAVLEDGSNVRPIPPDGGRAVSCRALGHQALRQVLAGRVNDSDAGLVEAMLRHWEVRSVDQLRARARYGFGSNADERVDPFAAFAPHVPSQASEGSDLARRICAAAVDALALEIEILGAYFASRPVKVALLGSIATSSFITSELRQALATSSDCRYNFMRPVLPPAAGAILFAYRQLGIPVTEDIVAALAQTDMSAAPPTTAVAN